MEIPETFAAQGIRAESARFTAEQAAQKKHAAANERGQRFTAEQAAQKSTAQQFKLFLAFTAE